MYLSRADLAGIAMNKEASEAALIAAAQAASGTNSALFALGGGLMAIATVAYMWIRRIKSDARDDSTLRFALDENVKVVTFIPPPVELGAAPIHINNKYTNIVPCIILPIFTVLKPAVLGVTEPKKELVTLP